MVDCCQKIEQIQDAPKRYNCPENNIKYGQVSYKTLLHHVKEPWRLAAKEQTYYFCEDPDCDVVYFGFDNSVICRNQLRIKIGIKTRSNDDLICYCFGVSKSEAQENARIKAFVVEQTKKSLCSCKTRNPSGKCCLKDFPKER